MLRHSVEEVVLPNGARGLLIDVPDASVMNVRINFRAGDVYTISDEKWETAHIMEHLTLGANKKYPNSSQFQAFLEKNGAYSNASTGHTEMTYEAECADFEWEEFFSLLTMGISEPLFLREDFEAECGNVYQELISRANNHSTRLAQELSKRYGLKGFPFNERKDMMQHVTLDDVLDHYKRTHFAQNMRFVVAGRMKGRKRKIKSALNNMKLPKNKSGERFLAPLETPKPFSEALFVQNETVPNAYFYIDTYCTRELQEREMYALSLLGTLLTDTLYSKILGRAREQGLIYYVSSNYYRTEAHSGWWFGSQIAEEQLEKFLAIFIEEIEKVRSGDITDKDLEDAKRYQLGGFQRGAQSVNSLVNNYLGQYLYNGEITSYYTSFPRLLGQITKQDLVDIANLMTKEKIWGVGFLGTISESARTSAYARLAKLWG